MVLSRPQSDSVQPPSSFAPQSYCWHPHRLRPHSGPIASSLSWLAVLLGSGAVRVPRLSRSLKRPGRGGESPFPSSVTVSPITLHLSVPKHTLWKLDGVSGTSEGVGTKNGPCEHLPTLRVQEEVTGRHWLSLQQEGLRYGE